MLRKNKRVFWLLNHKTLMPYETRLLERLGFEVFTPKIIPNAAWFRSGAVDYASDARLTIPPDVLKLFNGFDFYSSPWPSDITFNLNRYFGSAFVAPINGCFQEVMTKFEGQILLRAFGLDNTMTYEKALRIIAGSQAFAWIHAAGDRFWFAQGYEQLAECEPPLIADRALYTPLGLPDAFWRSKDRWTGERREILFVCPNVVSNPYYAQIYREFKAAFGDLPHVIVGAQDVPVDDPHMLGYVSDDQLDELYRQCAALFYHSREKRHLHYSPIEAAIVGTPIVFYDDCLLARLVGHRMQGAVATAEEAYTLLEKLVNGDARTIGSLREDQRSIGNHFSDEHCMAAWRAAADTGPWGAALRRESWIGSLGREATRSLRYRKRLGLVSAPIAPNDPPPDALSVPGEQKAVPLAPYESLAWFDPIDLGNGTVTPGAAPPDVFLGRADVFLGSVDPSESLLDVGEGEGFYAFEAERRGLNDVSFLSLMNRDAFRFAKHARRSNVKEVSANVYMIEGIRDTGFDCVLLRSVLNQVDAPLLLLQSAAKAAKRVVIVEAMLDLHECDRPVSVYYGAERREGLPETGWGFNRQFVVGALNSLGFTSVRFEPTPDARRNRGIFVATRRAQRGASIA